LTSGGKSTIHFLHSTSASWLSARHELALERKGQGC
jgi:hypothetical protein